MLEGGSQYGVPPPGEMASPISTLPHHQFAGNGLTPAAEEEEDHGGAAAGGGGNRWPRQETLSLLRIRSEMDSLFRDATLKAPLWEEVSRKLSELGYKRSAKKCKEKFENIHKYYKRTKEGRAGRQDGKNYRFFSELEALYSGGTATNPGANPAVPAAIPSQSEASTSSNDSDSDGGGEDKKMMSFFKGLIRQVVDRQEAMQNRFLETIEKREHERMMREEAWRRQDMARLAREHEAAAHDRAVAAERDASIISLLQQLAGHPPPPPPPPPLPTDDVGAASSSQKAGTAGVAGGRWPKAEVQALIKLRGEMEIKYQEVGPKGPLWEEISSEMRRLGYNRNAKRCKEKWENINKYFKKVKESNKRRPEDSKTCPYFHQLDALYRKKHVLATMEGGGTTSKVGDGVMDLTRREEDGERANSEEMVSDEGEREEEQYKIEYQPSLAGNGNINGSGAIYSHNSEKNQDQRSDLSPLSGPVFQV